MPVTFAPPHVAPAAPAPLAAPRLAATLGEVRALASLGRLAVSAFAPTRPARHRCRIIVVPGFRSGPRSTAPLRRHLARRGHLVEDWGLGVNCGGLTRPHGLADIAPVWGRLTIADYRGEAGVALMTDLLTRRVAALAAPRPADARPLLIAGWSLGGTIARGVARHLPEHVDGVITLAAPLAGGPRYTIGRKLLAALDFDWVARHFDEHRLPPVRQPILALYAARDGVVAPAATIDHFSPDVEARELDVAHYGIGLDPRSFATIDEWIDRRRPGA